MPPLTQQDSHTASAAPGNPVIVPRKDLDRAQSLTIKIARVACIFFMTSAHAWPGGSRVLDADVIAPLKAFYFVLIALLGHASVPLLSIISGLLFVSSFERRASLSVIKGKFKTLIVPMIAWSAPMVAIAYLAPYFSGEAPPRWGALDWVNAFFAITTEPANGPLHFFRDIFVMVLYSCLVMAVYRRSAAMGILLALAIALLEQKAGGFLVFRNQIAVMYLAGVLLAASGNGAWRPGWVLVVVGLSVYAVGELSGLIQEQGVAIVQMRLSQLLPRFAMAMLMWRLAFEIARSDGPLSRAILWLEPHIFVVFCAHLIATKVFGFAALKLGLSETASYYPVLLVAQMIAFIPIGVALSHVLTPFPWLRGKPSRATSPHAAGGSLIGLSKAFAMALTPKGAQRDS